MRTSPETGIGVPVATPWHLKYHFRHISRDCVDSDDNFTRLVTTLGVDNAVAGDSGKRNVSSSFAAKIQASGSWVNQVERWFAEITEKRIRRGSFTSVPSLEKAIQEYLDHHNENPKPFVWTADADLILGKIQRLCERISNSPKTPVVPQTTSS